VELAGTGLLVTFTSTRQLRRLRMVISRSTVKRASCALRIRENSLACTRFRRNPNECEEGSGNVFADLFHSLKNVPYTPIPEPRDGMQ
jgi:hypothetical protein